MGKVSESKEIDEPIVFEVELQMTHESGIKFPHVDIDGDVWIDESIFLTTNETTLGYGITPACRTDVKLYWRYKKAWNLMNR